MKFNLKVMALNCWAMESKFEFVGGLSLGWMDHFGDQIIQC